MDNTLTTSDLNTINLSLSTTYYLYSESGDTEYSDLLETIQNLYNKLSGGETLS